ncbi:MAG: four-helix bundle copper-binding protein [Paucimonas sp.]|nr:four-helix bundle copper-binding protein [Paucimonas sp.]
METAPQQASHVLTQLPALVQACIDACNNCADACDYCASSCLAEPDVNAMARCIALDMDCAQFCRMAASSMARRSEFAEPVCAVCARVCDACADECGKHQMAHCQACAQACLQCAQACRQMGAMSGSPRDPGSGGLAH